MTYRSIHLDMRVTAEVTYNLIISRSSASTFAWTHLLSRDALLHGRFDMGSIQLAYYQVWISYLDVHKEIKNRNFKLIGLD